MGEGGLFEKLVILPHPKYRGCVFVGFTVHCSLKYLNHKGNAAVFCREEELAYYFSW